jgi:cyclic pyranopterin phosphate synthase
LAKVLDGIEAARMAGFANIKINAVAVRGFNDDEIPAICAYAWERDLIPRFIEQMPMADGALFVPGTFMSAREIRDAVARSEPGAEVVALPPSRGLGAGPARYFRVDAPNREDGLGGTPANHGNGGDKGKQNRRFGIISAVTEHFCDTCNRVRLAANGALHTCLGYDDAVDLRGVLRARGEDAVVETIRAAVSGKRDGHTFGLLRIGQLAGGPKKAMVQIGG